MECLEEKTILDLPDETLEYIMTFLSFADLFKLSKEGHRLECCAKRILKEKSFSIAIIGGFDFCHYAPNCSPLNDVEVISIENDSVKHVKTVIISPLKRLCSIRGTQLQNGNLLVCGGAHLRSCEHEYGYSVKDDEYLLLNIGTNKWKKVETMKSETTFSQSSASLDGRLFTTGGHALSGNASTYHMDFSFEEGLKERKELPIALKNHTSTIYDHQNILISGGLTQNREKSKRTFIYNIKTDSWTEGPLLLQQRALHSSCAIQSDDGTTKCIIIIGGDTYEEGYSNSVELLNVKDLKAYLSSKLKWSLEDQMWTQGPPLPCGIQFSACVPLPPTTNFACLVIGGNTRQYEKIIFPSGKRCDRYDEYTSDVYGLNKELTEWKLLGKIRTGRSNHIALPLS